MNSFIAAICEGVQAGAAIPGGVCGLTVANANNQTPPGVSLPRNEQLRNL